MANNNKNKTPKKNLLVNTSGQKENRPKRNTTVKPPDPDEGIAMSKQLLTKRLSKPTNRIRSSKKPMPSLAELEKMFEDSDDDRPNLKRIKTDNISTPQDNQLTSITNKTQQGFETNTSQQDSDSIEQSPPNKRPKIEMDLEDCDDLPPVTISPTKNLVISEYKPTPEINQALAKHIDEEPTSDINQDVKTENTCNGHLSDASTDSNKTIEYQISPSGSQSELRMPTFSPLPSTSKDNQTIMRNDELFNKSLREIDKSSSNNITTSNLTSETENVTQSVNSETIVIDDEVIKIEDPVINLDIDNNDATQNTNMVNQNTSANQIQIEDDDDDDCVIIENVPTIIDLDEHRNNNNNSDVPATSASPDIIDVDYLIAENTSILKRLKKKPIHPTQSVIDVSFVDEKPRIMFSETNNQNVTVTAPANSTNTSSVQSESQQPTHENEVISVPVTTCEHLHNVPNIHRHRNNFNPPGSEYGTYHANNNTPFGYVQHTPYKGLSALLPSRSRRNQIQMSVFDFFRNLMCNKQRIERRDILPLNLDFNTLSRHQATNTGSTPKKCANQQNSQKNETATPQKNNGTSIQNSQLDSDKSIVKLGDCPICMETLSGRVIASTICGHVFCMRCLQTAVNTSKRCPTCRKILKKNGYHQIFL